MTFLVLSLVLLPVGSALIALGISQNIADESAIGTTPIFIGTVLVVVGLFLFWAAAYRLARQFHEMYLRVTSAHGVRL